MSIALLSSASFIFAQNSLTFDALNPPPSTKDSSFGQLNIKNEPYTQQELNNKHNECLKNSNNIGTCKQQYNELSEKGKVNLGYGNNQSY